ncbi:hypothetical protein ARALYDRAFT_911230 [Arabidopsis lyrata subsp. lyrata]|uniref:Uncharacterized protein n=1 Tax=Arabidopsis lyrata subsp. lyrata TaxID=81972 RepID=D7LXB8_ARALL|nr:putative defensin-like protein 211 [Arabidopsis lyrata subsp. lyrata]EFH48713.1 hypothetical protein ARALYDRAFT_911230 [Arabidopsis lyrata subsp. lyrata]|eukprot:XP_002872454.1 putative defensin-like protein 211 [Arabidopsis lyrata subsp. lyrata]
MKTAVLFLTLLILVFSCTSLVIKESNFEERAYPSHLAATPPIDQSASNKNLGFSSGCNPKCFCYNCTKKYVSNKNLVFSSGCNQKCFCYNCAKSCFRRGRTVQSCQGFVCRCHYGQHP